MALLQTVVQFTIKSNYTSKNKITDSVYHAEAEKYFSCRTLEGTEPADPTFMSSGGSFLLLLCQGYRGHSKPILLYICSI